MSKWPTRIEKPRKKHVVVDYFRDVVLECRCGWRTAARSLKDATRQFKKHQADCFNEEEQQ